MAELRCHNLVISRQTRVLINAFDAHFSASSITALIGNNGIGKSTLLHTLAGLHSYEGTIYLNNYLVQGLSRREKAQLLTLLTQSTFAHPYCFAHSRIAQGLIPHRGFGFKLRQDDHEQIMHIAKRLTIDHLLDKRLSAMSGGEQRLVHIAKCLVNQKIQVILLDEPSVFLDIEQKTKLAALLKDIAAQNKIIIFSSHDSDFINQCAGQKLIIKDYQATIA